MEPTQTATGSVETTAPEERRRLDDASLYANRELSWLDFNDRVLQLTEDETMPLLERAKFLAIWASNLDEFFMVRVAGLHDQVEAGIDARGPDGLSPSETIEQIVERVSAQATRHSREWESRIRSELAEEGLRVVSCDACDEEERARVDRIFREQIFPALTPLAVGPGRPFPYISNLSLSVAVWVRDPVSETETFARVKVPKEVLPRLVPIGGGAFVPLEDVIARHLDQLFPGMEILHHSVFRVARDADFTVSDEADDLLQAVEQELRRRRFGEVVRLEVGTGMRPELRDKLVEWLDLEERQAYEVEGLLDLTDLWQLYELDGYTHLRDRAWTPVIPPPFQAEEDQKADVFEAMRAGDLMVHQPYESFSASVQRFVAQAVEDPNVLA